jgi:hypothetical protein
VGQRLLSLADVDLFGNFFGFLGLSGCGGNAEETENGI